MIRSLGIEVSLFDFMERKRKSKRNERAELWHCRFSAERSEDAIFNRLVTLNPALENAAIEAFPVARLHPMWRHRFSANGQFALDWKGLFKT